MAKAPKSLAAAIRARGYDWVAGDTTLSALSAEKQKSYLGLTVSKTELEATAKAIAAATTLRALAAAPAAPAAIDWRNNGGDWTTPIKDQSSCGSCVSFGTCGTIESRIKIACRSAGMVPDLAEAHLFYCGCGNCCGTGWNFAPALDFAKNTGIAKESDFPYTPGNQACPPNLQPYIKITGWTSVLAAADRKNVLATKGPVVGGLAVYQDFFSYRTGVYRHVSGNLAGYHAISVVGYDDAQQCWICKNSWGAGWGDNGWFRIGYGEAMIDTSFAFYDVDLKCPTPSIDCRTYLPYITKVINACRGNPALRACLAWYVCRIGLRPPRCTASHIAVARALLTIFARCPKYREPFCRALR